MATPQLFSGLLMVVLLSFRSFVDAAYFVFCFVL